MTPLLKLSMAELRKAGYTLYFQAGDSIAIVSIDSGETALSFDWGDCNNDLYTSLIVAAFLAGVQQ